MGIAVVGPEGAATSALMAADLVCHSILDALDLVLDAQALASTLRPNGEDGPNTASAFDTGRSRDEQSC